MIPETLAEWTLERVSDLANHWTFEDDRFDFKETLPHRNNPSDKQRLRRSVAAFANNRGGFLIFGVKDDRSLIAAERVVGMNATKDFPAEFGSYPSECTPSIEWKFKSLPVSDERTVHVAHIPASRRGPHGVEEDARWYFPKRTNRGTEQMSYEEIRARFTDANRRRSLLAYLTSEMARVEGLAREINTQAYNGELLYVAMQRYNPNGIEATLPQIFQDLTDSDVLHGDLNSLRNALMEADVTLTMFGLRLRSDANMADEIRHKINEDARRILGVVPRLIGELRRIVI